MKSDVSSRPHDTCKKAATNGPSPLHVLFFFCCFTDLIFLLLGLSFFIFYFTPMDVSPYDDRCNRSSLSLEFLRGAVLPEISEAEVIPLEWTDEKHSQYLKSMEASFMNQLYDSMELPGWRSDKENLSNLQSWRHNKCVYSPSDQFKVQRDGCWKKKSFEGPCSQSNTSAESRVFLKSTCVRYFKSDAVPLGLAASSDLCKIVSSRNHLASAKGKNISCPAVKSKQRHASVSYLLGLVGDDAEVSDQNFADDLGFMNQNASCSAKRTRTLGTDSPFNDQVVPFSEAAPSGDNTAEKQSSLSNSAISTASD